MAKGGHTITANVALRNSGWGIHATGQNVDGGGNAARDNGQRAQCFGVVCTAEAGPPDTHIDDAPPPATSVTTARFTFTGIDDVTPAAGLRFECRLVGGGVDDPLFAPCGSPQSYPDLAAGRYTFEVRAIDGAGKVDPTPAAHTWTIDTVAPDTTIDAGPDDPTESTSASFTFSANEAASFSCSLDGTAFTTCTSPATFTGLAPGAHDFTVRATDAAGNTDVVPAAFAWTVTVPVDNTPPDTRIDTGPANPTTATSATFTFSATEPATFVCSLDGEAFTACTSPITYTDRAAQGHDFSVIATDAAGNADPTPATFSWTVSPDACAGGTVTAAADADSWVAQKDPGKNFATDSILKVDAKNQEAARGLVRFALPPLPAGCRITGAELQLQNGSGRAGRTIHALPLAGPWTESAVTWRNQPATAGAPVAAPSASGTMRWTVTDQVRAMYDGLNHGFLVRDADERSSGREQQFHSREKGTDNPPRLVITYG